MKAILARIIGATGAAVPVYMSTGDWKMAAVTFAGFAIYGTVHTVTSGATGSSNPQ